MPEATTEDKPAVAAASIMLDGRLRQVQRRASDGALPWQFPAGGVELGEAYAEAVVRETSEEAGLAGEAVKVLGERIQPEFERPEDYVACQIKGGTAYAASAEELSDFAWAEPKSSVFARLMPSCRWRWRKNISKNARAERA